MAQRKQSTKQQESEQQKIAALHQYEDTDGHFSLVRYAKPVVHTDTVMIPVVQKFPSG